MMADALAAERLDEIERNAALFAWCREPRPGDQIDHIWLSSSSARVLLGLAQRDVPALVAEIRRLHAERRP